MDAIWYGIADLMQWIFKIIKPIGTAIDYIFIFLIAAGAVYWLWYDMYERKGGRNYMSEGGSTKG